MSVYRISKTFRFSAGHSLPDLPEGHKCRRAHGHNYVVTLVLEAGALDGWGMVRDYGELAPVRAWINAELDHRVLDQVMPQPTTAEHLAAYIFATWGDQYPELVEVVVCETPDTTASYRP